MPLYSPFYLSSAVFLMLAVSGAPSMGGNGRAAMPELEGPMFQNDISSWASILEREEKQRALAKEEEQAGRKHEALESIDYKRMEKEARKRNRLLGGLKKLARNMRGSKPTRFQASPSSDATPSQEEPTRIEESYEERKARMTKAEIAEQAYLTNHLRQYTDQFQNKHDLRTAFAQLELQDKPSPEYDESSYMARLNSGQQQMIETSMRGVNEIIKTVQEHYKGQYSWEADVKDWKKMTEAFQRVPFTDDKEIDPRETLAKWLLDEKTHFGRPDPRIERMLTDSPAKNILYKHLIECLTNLEDTSMERQVAQITMLGQSQKVPTYHALALQPKYGNLYTAVALVSDVRELQMRATLHLLEMEKEAPASSSRSRRPNW